MRERGLHGCAVAVRFACGCHIYDNDNNSFIIAHSFGDNSTLYHLGENGGCHLPHHTLRSSVHIPMTLTRSPFPSSSVSDEIFCVALGNYTRQTGIDLMNNPLTIRVKNCDTPNAILDILREQVLAFDGVKHGNAQLLECLMPIRSIIDCLHVFSTHHGPSGSARPVSLAISVLNGLNNRTLIYILGFHTDDTYLFRNRHPSCGIYFRCHFQLTCSEF